MQGLPRTDLETVLDEPLVLCVDGSFPDFRAAVPFIVEDGMPDAAHVNPDLVRPTGFEFAFDDGDVSVAFEHLVMGHRMLSDFGIVREHFELQAVGRISADVSIDRSFRFFQIPPHHGHVAPFDGMFEKLLGQFDLRLLVFRHHQQTGGVLVDSVDQDSHPLILRFRSLGQPQMKSQGIDEGPLVVPVPGVDHHAGRLVHDQDVRVLEDDVKRDVFRKYFHAPAPIGHHKLDDVPGADDEVRLGRLVIDQNISHADRALYPVPRRIFQTGGHELVHAHRFLAGIHIQAEMLEHALLFVLDVFFRIVMEKVFFHQGSSAVRTSVSSLRYRLTSEPMMMGALDAPGDCLYTTASNESE